MNRLKNSYSGCMNCGGKIKMKSGGKSYPKAVTKSAYSAATTKKANLAKTLAGMRKGEDGLLNSKKSFADPMAADAVVNQSAPMLAGNTINRQEQDEMMSMAPRVKAVDPLNLAANTDLNKSIGKSLTPQMQKVKSYQEMLRSKGYNIAADGAWGPQTQKAYEAYIKSKTTAAAKPTSVPAKTTSKSSSQNWNYSASQWDAAQKENAMRPVAGAGYGPTKAEKMNFAPVAKAAVVPKAPIAAPGKPAAKKATPDQLPNWAKKVVAQNPKSPIKRKS